MPCYNLHFCKKHPIIDFGNACASTQKGKWYYATTRYKDANGNVYADIGDGQYEVYGADGKKIGVVAKDSVDVSQMEKTTKGGIKNGLKSAGKARSVVAGKVGKGVTNLAGKAKDGIVNFAKGVGNTVGGFMKQIQNVGSAIINGQKQIEVSSDKKNK